jgi:hypothetical protein
MVFASITFALLLSAAPGKSEQAPTWLTFDVLNSEASGKHRILHLGDLLSSRSDIPDLPTARGVMIYATTFDQCSNGACLEIAGIVRETAPLGGLVLVLLLDPAENLSRPRKEIPAARYAFPVIQDTHGIVRDALGLDRPGEIVVINSDAKIVRFSPASDSRAESERKLSEAKKVFVGALRRDKED